MGDEYIPPDAQAIEVKDDKYLADWIKYGFGELDGYMKKVARFEDWCRRHPTEETDESAS